MLQLIPAQTVRKLRSYSSKFQIDYSRLPARYSMQFAARFVCLAIAASLCGCGAPSPVPKSESPVLKSESPAPPQFQDQTNQDSGKSSVIGTRWRFQESAKSDGTPVFTYSVPASDANFQDLPQALGIACYGTAVLVQIGTPAEFPTSASKIPIHYSLDRSPPQPLSASVNADGHQLLLGTAAFARRLFSAEMLSIDTSVGEPLYFNLAGLTDIRTKLAQVCPKARL